MSDGGDINPAQAVVICDFCDTHDNVKWVCHTCGVNLCQKCKEIHLKNKKFRSHNVCLRLEERTNSTIQTTKCQEHSSLYCSAFCENCKIPICIKCAVENHKHHDALELKEAFDKYTARLKSIKDFYKSQNLTQIGERRKHLQHENERVNTEATAAVNVLKEERTIAMTAMSKVYDKLEKDIIQARENQQKMIHESLKSLDEIEGVIEKRLEQCEKLEASRDLSVFNFVNECPESADLRPGEVYIGEIKVVPGSITSSYIEERACKVFSDLNFESMVPPFQSEASVVDNGIIRSFTALFSKNEFKGASVIQYEKLDEIWMSNEWSSFIFLYNSQGSKVTSISTGFEIYGFDMDCNGDIIATDFDHKRVKKISKTGRVVTLISSVPSKPCGVCLNHKQEIVLSLAGTNALSVYSPDGRRLVHKVGGTGKLFRQPYRLTQNGNHDYCVVDSYDKVIVVDVGGSHRWTYFGQQGEKFSPYSIVCDSCQCLVISDSKNHRIHLVDKYGHLIKILLTKDDGIEYPTGLCVDKDGRLWVGQKDGKVHVVKHRCKSDT